MRTREIKYATSEDLVGPDYRDKIISVIHKILEEHPSSCARIVVSADHGIMADVLIEEKDGKGSRNKKD